MHLDPHRSRGAVCTAGALDGAGAAAQGDHVEGHREALAEVEVHHLTADVGGELFYGDGREIWKKLCSDVFEPNLGSN
jgi:hypothetical protein